MIDQGYGVTRNDPNLFRQMSPTLERVAGDRFIEASQTTTAEDFSYFANEVPGLFLFLGVAPDDPSLDLSPTTRLASMRTNGRSRWESRH